MPGKHSAELGVPIVWSEPRSQISGHMFEDGFKCWIGERSPAAVRCVNGQGKHGSVAPISLCGGCEGTRAHNSALVGALSFTRGAPGIMGRQFGYPAL